MWAVASVALNVPWIWAVVDVLQVYASTTKQVAGETWLLPCFVWLAFSITGLLFPGTEDKIFTYGQPLMFGEVAVMLWLVIMGAREPRLAAPSAGP